MKTLIATTVLILAAGSAQAWQPAFDGQEFYSGQPDASLVTRSETAPESLYVEGNADTGNRADWQNEGDAIGHIDADSDLYAEAAYDV